MKVLAIETSCDDTSLALVSYDWDTFVCEAMVSFTQVNIHDLFGGVVPELASREHLHQILIVLQALADKCILSIDDMMYWVDSIAVTQIPWLPWSLIIGKTLANFLSIRYDKKLIYVNHLHGHIFSFVLDRNVEIIKRNNLVLSVSWWHSDLSILSKNDVSLCQEFVYVDTIWQYNITKIWTTRDDAIGEVYDKLSRLLWWPYPWWIRIDKKAAEFLDHEYSFDSIPKISFKRILLEENSFDFSFSGMKSQAYTFINNYKTILWLNADDALPDYLIQHICYEFQEAATDILIKKIFMVINRYDIELVAIVWWVSASLRLREKFIEYKNTYERTSGSNLDFYVPNKFVYCTDNAAMIWAVGILQQKYIN